MAFNERLPLGVELPEPPRVCVSGDLLPDGSYGVEWLVVTRDQVMVFSNGAGPAPRLTLPLRELRDPRLEMMVGAGALEVERDGRRIELARFTNSRSRRFGPVARALEKWCKGEEAELEADEENACPRCGMALERHTTVCPYCVSYRRTLWRLLGYLRPFRPQVLCLTLLACGTTAVGLLQPYLFKPLFDGVIYNVAGLSQPERLQLLGVLALIVLGSRFLGAGFQVLQGWLSAWLGHRISHGIRAQLFQHLQFLSLSFYDKRQMGTVVSRINQDTNHLQHFLLWGAQELFNNFFMIVGIGVMLFVMDWKLALMVFAPAPVVAILSASFFQRIRLYMHRFFYRWGRLNALLTESLTGLRVVKAFAREEREISRFTTGSEDVARAGVLAERTWAVLFSGLGLTIMLGWLLAWYFGGRKAIAGDMSPGTYLAFMVYVQMFYGPIQAMSNAVNHSARSLSAAERVFEVLNNPPETGDREQAAPLPRIEGKVELRDVTFGYEKNKPVLKKLNLTVSPGEMVGLVGKSGAGKTTTVNLVCRFYEAEQGEVLVDGVDLRRARLSDLRRQIGIVPQDTFLFSGTIRDNIAYAKPEAGDEEIVRAAKVANAHDFILRKPDGYETMIGEGGQGLSSGERQRIAIARAVLHNPRILILDEATSQVDVETEKQIQEAIGELIAGRTTIAIAHRLSTLKNANRLIVLKDGEVAEEGTHDELMERKGEFHRLVEMYQQVSRVRAVER